MTESPVATAAPQVAPPPPVSRRTAVAVGAAAAALFAVLTVWVAARGSAPTGLDEHLHRWVVAHRGPASVAVARAVRWAGVSWIVLPALIVVGAAAAARPSRNGRLGSGLLLCLAASTGVYAEIFCNKLLGRARPPVQDWAGAAAGGSYPSGHTTAATMFALAAAWALAARVRPGWRRRAVWAGAGVYAVTVGWSRVWLGVHWPTDVAGAWLFGLAWLAGSAMLLSTAPSWARWRSRRPAQPDAEPDLLQAEPDAELPEPDAEPPEPDAEPSPAAERKS